ncbi:hypothetical protein D3C84_589530 [compost metagenome]
MSTVVEAVFSSTLPLLRVIVPELSMLSAANCKAALVAVSVPLQVVELPLLLSVRSSRLPLTTPVAVSPPLPLKAPLKVASASSMKLMLPAVAMFTALEKLSAEVVLTSSAPPLKVIVPLPSALLVRTDTKPAPSEVPPE